MKPPTESDLTELENIVLRYWQIEARSHDGFSAADRVVGTMEYLIARARFLRVRFSLAKGCWQLNFH